MVESFCNDENPPEKSILLKGNEIKLAFTTSYYTTKKGFKIEYKSVKPGKWKYF